MAEREVNSPVNTRHPSSKVSGNIPGFSPGAKSDPSHRGDQAPSHAPEPGSEGSTGESRERQTWGGFGEYLDWEVSMTTRSEAEVLGNPIGALVRLHDMLCVARTRGCDFDLAHAYKLCLRVMVGFSGPQFDGWVDEWEQSRCK